MAKLANELGTENIGELLIKQAVPATIGILVMSLNMIVDTIFVGQVDCEFWQLQQLLWFYQLLS